jgi:catechol 2,3-dioxygenase-like lactoylglutathione lyase family enzyme
MHVTSRLPGVRGVDHFGITVPDLEEAHVFFTELIGCEYLYRLGPYQDAGTWMSEHLGVADNTVMRQLRFYRLGGQAIFEVFLYEADNQRRDLPRNSDLGGHHVAIYVDDMDAAVQVLRDSGIRVLGEPTVSRGASEGQKWVYFLAPWGMQFELVSYPNGKAFDHNPEAFA